MRKFAKVNDDVKYNPFQEKVLNNKSKDMIIAHAVGSGKTLSGIAKFEKLKEEGKAQKALVIAPASLRNNFGESGVKKFTDSSYNIIGNKAEIKKGVANNVNSDSDYNIVSYEMFRKNPNKFIDESKADTIIADEIHKLKNDNTATINSFYDLDDRYKNFIGLTGSLISNRISDAYNLVDLASRKKHNLGADKAEFEEKFLKRSTNPAYKGIKKEKIPITGFKNKRFLKKELNKYIDYVDIDSVRPFAKIPRKNLSVKKIPLTKDQATQYKKLLRENPELMELVTKKRLEVFGDDEMSKAFNSFIEGRKLMNSPGSVLPGIPLKDTSKSPKVKTLIDDLENHLNKTPDGQALVLTNLINGGIDVLEAALKDRNIEYGKFIGKGNKGITEEGRQKDVQDYINKKKKVMLISGAGGEGLSLGDTTWEGNLDPHYNPERINQMEARGIRAFGQSHRKDKDKEVDVTRYIATMPKRMGVIKSRYKTPDELIYEVSQNKDRQNKLLFDLLKK